MANCFAIMKRSLTASSTGPSEQPSKRRKVKHETYKKWVTQYDRDCQTVTWLDCETSIEAGVKRDEVKMSSVHQVRGQDRGKKEL